MTETLWIHDSEDYQCILEKWQNTVDVMAEACMSPAGFIVQHTKDGFMTAVASSNAENPYGTGIVVDPDTNLYCKRVVETKKVLCVNDATKDRYWDDNPEIKDGLIAYLGLPIFWPNGEMFGTICILNFKSTHYPMIFQKLMFQFRDIIEADLQLLENNKLLREMAIRDELTGLYNRRGFKDLAQQQHKLACRLRQSVGLLYLDIDDLKEINDQIGHAAGDEAIKATAKVLQEALRSNDISARIGGDEFVAMVFLEALDTMEIVIERLERRLINEKMTFERPLSVSIGGILVPEQDVNFEKLVVSADKKMYQNKKSKKKN